MNSFRYCTVHLFCKFLKTKFVSSGILVVPPLPTELWRNINVGIFLFSQAVASQLSSALQGLTSVFGMGTGGPPASSTPTF